MTLLEHSTSLSCFFLYSCRAFIEVNFSPHSFDISIRSVFLIIVPSSFMISQQRPHSFRPASLIRSTVASVCPFLSRTPLGLAFRGNICPGLRKSLGFTSSATQALAVKPLSTADIPVVVSTWSIDTVKAVSWLSVLLTTIWSRPSFLQYSALIGMHISPLPYVAIKLIFSVVANSAAQIRSPSFSLSSSSVTKTIFPCLKSSNTSSIVLSLNISFSS